MTEKETRSRQAVDSSTDSRGPLPAASEQALRRGAEEIARSEAAQVPEALEAVSPEAARQMLHELRVHQIELEMQNEELRRSQEALESSWARYFDLYDLAPVSYFTLSEKGLILEANLTAAGLLGVARSALVTQPLSLFILAEDQDIYYLHCKQLTKTSAPQAFELRMAKKDGAPFWAWLEATVAQDADGAPVWRVVVSDVTERKQTEQALRTAEALRESALPFRQLAESLPQLVWTCRADGLCDYLSPQWVEYTGVPEEEQLGLGWLKQLHPEDRAHTVITWDRAVDAGALFDSEFRIRRHDGLYHWFKTRAVPLRDGAGQVTKWFGTNTDIEDERSAEETPPKPPGRA